MLKEINWIKEHFKASLLGIAWILELIIGCFQPQTENIFISRDVHFMEDEKWNWDDAKKMDLMSKDFKANQLDLSTTNQSMDIEDNEMVDDVPHRGTRYRSSC